MGELCGGEYLVIDKSVISEIKNSLNIVDVIGEVVPLQKAGRNYLGNCPFHKEKTPSFNVVEDKQFYHCFGCGKSGDVFKFIEEFRNVTFAESVNILGERLGLAPLVQTNSSPSQHHSPHQSLYQINQEAAKFYHAVLMTTKIGEEAKQYLYQRGIDDELIRHFNLGLAPDESDFLYQAMAKKFDEDAIAQSGLFTLSDNNRVYDSFRNRIMFPLKDDRGRGIGFSGRIWTEADVANQQAKYKNTRATVIFNKSYELYHLDGAKAVAAKEHELFLMEGFMDVIAAYRSGIENAVASMGTALTPEHVQHLKRFTKKVILTYDGDNAGQNAIAKSLDLLKDFQTEIVQIPNQMDPDEFLQKNSPEELAKLLKESRISDVEFWIQYLKPANTDNLQAEIAFVEQIAPIVASAQSITAQNTYITKIAELLPDFDYFQVEQAVNSVRVRTRTQVQQQPSQRATIVELPMAKRLTALVKAENQLLHRLLHFPYLLQEYRNREEFRFETQTLQTLYALLCQNGELTSIDLNHLDEATQQAYYQVLEENLPDEIAEGELQEIEARRDRFLEEQDLRKQSQLIRDSSNQGDVDSAVAALEALIAQKRRME
ncbi:DNA primase [Streptococcus caprae]|uniref:DNA primase n=1 Tax=Streptococcus caprae TaxID=1640501 RepID=A0ABV8CVH7_9STRE